MIPSNLSKLRNSNIPLTKIEISRFNEKNKTGFFGEINNY